MAGTFLRMNIWKNAELVFIEIEQSSSGRDGNTTTSRFSPKVPLLWLTQPALRHALRHICVWGCLPFQEHSLPYESNCMVPPHVGWIRFGSGAVVQSPKGVQPPKKLQPETAWLVGLEPTTTKNLVPFQISQTGLILLMK